MLNLRVNCMVVFFCGLLMSLFVSHYIYSYEVISIPWIGEGLKRMLEIPPDLSGKYFYITTPQEQPELSLTCGNSKAIKIGGVAEIEHHNVLLDPSVSISGERVLCVPQNNAKTNLPSPDIRWNSVWAAFSGKGADRLLRSEITIEGAKRTGYINFMVPYSSSGEIPSRLKGEMRYLYNDTHFHEGTHIELYRCNDLDGDCRVNLGKKLNSD